MILPAQKSKRRKTVFLRLVFGTTDELLVGKLILMGSDIEISATKVIPYIPYVMFYDS